MTDSIRLKDKVSGILVDLLHGEDIAVDELSDQQLRRIAQESQRIVSLTSSHIHEFFEDHSFLCDDCGRRVGGEPHELGHHTLCPGCMNFHMLSQETMRQNMANQDPVMN